MIGLTPATFEEFEREAARGNVVPVVRSGLARRAGLAPMAGGAVGYVAYNAARWFEPVLTRDLRPAAGADDAVFMLFRTVLAFDRVRQQIEITSCVMTDEAAESRDRLRELYDAAVAETERVERILSEAASAPPSVDEGDG